METILNHSNTTENVWGDPKMSKEVIITNYKNHNLIVYQENDRAIEMFLKSSETIEIGDICIGKVKNIVDNIQAAFVEVSPGIVGYYSLKNNTSHLFTNPINRKLCAGDEILVQIERGSIKSKAPVLTSHIQLQGEHLVLLANHHFIGISKKINNTASRERLKNFAQILLTESEHGIIFRTQAEFVSDVILKEEYDCLLVDYNNIMSTSKTRTCFSKIYSMPHDWLNYVHVNNIENLRIITDIPEVYNQLKSKSSNSLLSYNCELYSDASYPLIKLKRIESQIEKVLSKHVWLRSGASLVIEPTEALTSIDVNTGKTEIRRKQEDTFLQINLEAAHEIFRQIRLRNLSGIIIIDFINMSDKKNEELLMSEMHKLAANDPVQLNVIDITPLGLVEITRKRIYRPFFEQLKENCYE